MHLQYLPEDSSILLGRHFHWHLEQLPVLWGTEDLLGKPWRGASPLGWCAHQRSNVRPDTASRRLSLGPATRKAHGSTSKAQNNPCTFDRLR